MTKSEMEDSLRAMLTERAERVAPNDLLAQKIINQATAGTGRTRQGVRRSSWMLPLLAAAAVIAVVAAGITAFSLHRSTTGGSPIAIPRTQVPVSHAASTPAPVTHTTFTDASDLATTADSSATAIGLENFTVGDLTFVGDNVWALGTATCLVSGRGVCTAFVHSSDGTHWTTINSTPFNVPGDTGTDNCAVRCVSHMRFASPQIGYVYGPSALLMTLDGGKSWQLERGGAVALETLDGNVIRVEQSNGCPPGCTYTIQTAPIGSTHWKTVPVNVPLGDGVQLSRNGSDAYLLVTQNPAGGSDNETSALLVSTDDGASWTSRGEPCAQDAGQDGEVDSTSLTTGGGDGSVIVTCEPRLAQHDGYVSVSPAGGDHFTAAARGTIPPGATAVGAGTASDICVVSGQLYCSADGGASFTSTKGPHGGPGRVSFIGFEDGTEGRALEIDGSAANGAVSHLWTTTDGGRSWSVGSIAS